MSAISQIERKREIMETRILWVKSSTVSSRGVEKRGLALLKVGRKGHVLTWGIPTMNLQREVE
jgi:hypothetical protein